MKYNNLLYTSEIRFIINTYGLLTQAEGFVTGMAAKMFVIAGPVIVFGMTASVVYGLILVLFDIV